MAKLFRQYRPTEPDAIPYYKPVYAEPRTRSGLPPLPTPGTGWRYNYQVEAGPNEYVPLGRPRDDGTYKPFKADYQTYNHTQTYDNFGKVYPQALGAEESKDDYYL